MSKLFKDEKIFKKFKKDYSFIFNDNILKNKIKNHFDSNGSLACFILMFLEITYKKARARRYLEMNKEKWLRLFTLLYSDQDIIDAYNDLELNPCIDFDVIKKSFSCFNGFNKELLQLLNQNQVVLGLDDQVIKEFITKGFGYLIYSKIDCDVLYDIADVVEDPKHDAKVQMVIYNTRLFSDIKNLILKYCNDNVNDFIVLILGMTKRLSWEK